MAKLGFFAQLPIKVNKNCRSRYEVSTGIEFETTFPIIQHWLVEIGGTIHVDGSYLGPELGTPNQPFNTVTEGHSFAWDDPASRIRIAAGNYPEALTLNKAITVLAMGGTVVIGQ